MDNMNLFDSVPFRDHQIVIDRLLEGECSENPPLSSGAGRKVYLIDGFIYKVPSSYSKNRISGVTQNNLELKVWSDCKNKDLLCECIYFYKNVLVQKALESDPDVMFKLCEQKFNCTLEDYIREPMRAREVVDFGTKYKLDLRDLFHWANWGFDYASNQFKILDYGGAEIERSIEE